jgi:hypothetical protein
VERGDQKRIAKFTGLTTGTISNAFNGKSIEYITYVKVMNAMHHLNIPTNDVSFNYKKTLFDRWDIYNNLPHGAKARIARKCGCSKSEVTRILEGRKKDVFGVVKEAELEAAINIWKTRFCKYESKLD